MKRIAFILIFFAGLFAACAPNVATTPQPVVITDAPATAAGEFDLDNWDSVLAAAKGQTLNWYIWGGSDSINAFVDNFYGTALQERYGITLNRVPVADTVDAVNQVLSEKQAGTDPGAVDLDQRREFLHSQTGRFALPRLGAGSSQQCPCQLG